MSEEKLFDAFSADVLEDFPYLDNCESDYLDILMSYLFYNILPIYFEPETDDKVSEYHHMVDGGDEGKIHQHLAAGIRRFNAMYDTEAKR
jgi:hypothetical protein